MKAAALYVFFVFVVVIASSQSTCDFTQDEDCANKDDLELLWNQVILLNEKVNRVLATLLKLFDRDVIVAPRPTSEQLSRV